MWDAVHVGANLVFSSIVASTATTVVVFLPIAMMDGMSGQLFRDVCYTIVFSLLASMLGALALVPLLFVKMRPREKLTSRSHVMMHALEGKYEALLRRRCGPEKLCGLCHCLPCHSGLPVHTDRYGADARPAAPTPSVFRWRPAPDWIWRTPTPLWKRSRA